jgi:hypothetical protein
MSSLPGLPLSLSLDYVGAAVAGSMPVKGVADRAHSGFFPYYQYNYNMLSFIQHSITLAAA